MNNLKQKHNPNYDKPDTLAVIEQKENTSNIVLPAEICRPIELYDPPSLEGQKLLKFMIKNAGSNITKENYRHDFFLSDLNANPDFNRNYTVRTIEKVLVELMRFRVTLREGTNFSSGVMIQIADSLSTNQGRILITYRFGNQFSILVKQSKMYSVIDSATVYSFTSKHSMPIYDFVNSVYKINKNYTEEKFSLDEFRKMMGIPPEKYPDFNELHRNVLDPAFEDTNPKISDFGWTYKTHKAGKKVSHISIMWVNHKAQDTMISEANQKPFPLEHWKSATDNQYNYFPINLSDQANEVWQEYALQILRIKQYSKLHEQFVKTLRWRRIEPNVPDIKQLFTEFATDEFDPNAKLK